MRLQLSVALPALLLVALLAEPLLELAFGAAWTPAAPALSLLCIAALATACGQTLTGLALARRRLRRTLAVQWAGAVLTAALVAAAVWIDASLVAVATGVMCASLLTAVGQQVRLGGEVPGSGQALARDLSRLAVPALLSVLVMLGVERLSGTHHLLRLVLPSATGVGVFYAAGWWLAREQLQPLTQELGEADAKGSAALRPFAQRAVRSGR